MVDVDAEDMEDDVVKLFESKTCSDEYSLIADSTDSYGLAVQQQKLFFREVKVECTLFRHILNIQLTLLEENDVTVGVNDNKIKKKSVSNGSVVHSIKK